MRAHTVIDSAVGTLTLVVAEEDPIAGLYLLLQRHLPGDELGEPDPGGCEAEPFKVAAGRLDPYFAR
jgi:hypothetical protein